MIVHVVALELRQRGEVFLQNVDGFQIFRIEVAAHLDHVRHIGIAHQYRHPGDVFLGGGFDVEAFSGPAAVMNIRCAIIPRS